MYTIPKFAFILIILCAWNLSLVGQSNSKEHQKLTGYILKGIFSTNEIMDSIVSHTPAIVMLSFHLVNGKKLDSVTVLCNDTTIVKAMKKITYDKFAITWEFLLPKFQGETLRTKNVTLLVPTLLLKDLDESNKRVFSKNDIETIFSKEKFKESVTYSLENSALIKPIEIRVNSFH